MGETEPLSENLSDGFVWQFSLSRTDPASASLKLLWFYSFREGKLGSATGIRTLYLLFIPVCDSWLCSLHPFRLCLLPYKLYSFHGKSLAPQNPQS